MYNHDVIWIYKEVNKLKIKAHIAYLHLGVPFETIWIN